MRATAPTVFRCGASRNKREGVLSPEPIGDLEPRIYVIFYSDFAAGAQRASSSCNPPRRVRRTARLCESQEQRLFCQVQPLSPERVETCGAYCNVSCGPPLGEASARATLRVAKAQPTSSDLSPERVETCGAHSNVSCGPPLGEASARATLRVAKAQPNPRPKALPRVRLTAAPLSLRRLFARLARFIYIRLPPK